MLLDAKSYYTDDALKIYSIVHKQIERQSSVSYVVNDNLDIDKYEKNLNVIYYIRNAIAHGVVTIISNKTK